MSMLVRLLPRPAVAPTVLALLTVWAVLFLALGPPVSAAEGGPATATSAEPANGTRTAPKTGDTTYRTAEGRWVSAGCEPSGPVAIERDFVLTGRTWTLEAPIYADRNCTVPLFTVWSAATTGSWVRRRTPTEPGRRFSIGYRQVIPMSQDVADAMTAAGCGDTASFVGVPTDILRNRVRPLGQQSRRPAPWSTTC
jgi:hypothetical protein